MFVDLVRTAAAVLIFWYHMNAELSVRGTEAVWCSIDAGRNIGLGQLGTALFILLSGYTSCLSYRRISTGRRPWLSYYKKRLVSILPMFYIAYILAFLVLRLPDRSYDRTLIYTLFGMDGYLSMHGLRTCYLVGEWFTGCILLLYLLFPAIYALSEKKPLILLAGAVLIKVAALLVIHKTGLTDNDLLFYLPDFIFGVLIFRYRDRIPAVAGWICLVLFLILMLIPLPVSYRICITPCGVTLFLVFLWLSGLLEKHAGEKTSFLRLKKLLAAAAKYTYAIFLTHHVVISLVLRPISGQIGFRTYVKLFVTAFIFTILTAVSVYGINEYLKQLLPSKKMTAGKNAANT